MFGKIQRLMLNHPFATLICVAGGTFVAHLFTVADYPQTMYDEIEILDMGRFCFYDKFPTWSVNLYTADDGAFHPPAPYFHYLAGTLMETCFRIFHSHVAPRITMLASLPCAALALFAWLRAKRFSVAASLLVGSLFALDPSATVCAHWYRPDLWCLCLSFAALALMARKPNAFWPSFFAGALFGTSIFFWITSFVLAPVFLAEALQNAFSCDKNRARAFLTTAAGGIGGGLCAAAIWLIPLYPHLTEIVDQYLNRSEFANAKTMSGKGIDVYLRDGSQFVKIVLRSPFVWGAALLGACSARRHKLQTATFLLTCAFVLATRVYHMRMVYVMPYLFLLAAAAADRFLATGASRRLPRLYAAGALSFGVGVSLVTLTYAALPAANTLAELTEKMRGKIPGESPSVYVYDHDHELYYVGRTFNWKMFTYDDRTLLFEPNETANLIDRIDAVVIAGNALKPPTATQLEELERRGFCKTAHVEMPKSPFSRAKQALAAFFFTHGYPSCDVWTKTRPNAGLQQ